MGIISSLFGSTSTIKPPAERWLDQSECKVDSIRHFQNASTFLTEDYETCKMVAAVAFMWCSFSVLMFIDPGNIRYKKFMDSVREAAVNRYGENIRIYLKQCTHFTTECNNIGEMCRTGYGSLIDRLIPSITVLACVWLVEAFGGNSSAAYKFTPSVTPKTLFGVALKDSVESMIRAFKEYA